LKVDAQDRCHIRDYSAIKTSFVGVLNLVRRDQGSEILTILNLRIKLGRTRGGIEACYTWNFRNSAAIAHPFEALNACCERLQTLFQVVDVDMMVVDQCHYRRQGVFFQLGDDEGAQLNLNLGGCSRETPEGDVHGGFGGLVGGGVPWFQALDMQIHQLRSHIKAVRLQSQPTTSGDALTW
jgi:hypothetical protein